MRAMLIGDIHLADRPPSIRTDDYAEHILEKLAWVVKTAREMNCDCIVLAGDVFHIKAPTRTSHRLVQATVDVLTSGGLRVYVVPGNHDLTNDRIDSLAKQPLGTLCKAEGIDLLIGPHPELPLYGLEWLQDWSKLPTRMLMYRQWADSLKAEDMDFKPLLVTHAPIFPPGVEPPYEFISSDDWAEFQQNGACMFGHIHDPYGVWSAGNGVIFCNHGAISRGSLHEATLKREPAVTLYDDSEVGEAMFTRIAVPVRPVEEVFRMQEKEDVDERVKRAEAFLTSIGNTTLEGLSIETVREAAKQLKPATRQVVEEAIEEVLSR